MKQKMSKVYLVGAGPGDAGLISVKGMECIKSADVIVYDYLVSPRLLTFASPQAEIIYVGKSGSEHTMEQEDINKLLIKKTKEKKVVVRLKGGDPFIFGRGGEEALGLVKEKIPFEVVPGISSAYAVPAYAGIPVTHRGFTSTVAFVTGHEDPTKEDSQINWENLATGVGTIVFLMGVKKLPLIVEQLVKNGRNKTTPIALIRWGTTPRQETIVGTLENIVEKVKRANFKPPAITVVGEVINLREKLAWFEKKPLFGKKIIVTRSRTQASELVRALEDSGAQVIEFPTIKIVPPDSYNESDRAIKKILNFQLSDSSLPYDWVIFTSTNGVEHFFERLNVLGGDSRVFKGIKIAAIGSATGEKLGSFGLKADFVPEEYRAEAIIEGFKKFGIKGKQVLIPRAEVAREVLPEKLAELGAKVEVATAYKTVADESKVEEVKNLLEKKEVDMVTFTSSSTAKNFVELLKGLDLNKVLENVTIASIGPITSQTLKELGLKVDITTKKYTIEGLVESIVSSYQLDK